MDWHFFWYEIEKTAAPLHYCFNILNKAADKRKKMERLFRWFLFGLAHMVMVMVLLLKIGAAFLGYTAQKLSDCLAWCEELD